MTEITATSMARWSSAWESRGWPLALGRSALAMATLTEILFTAPANLVGTGVSSRCYGFATLSLWCLGESQLLARWGAAAILLLVVIGYRPRWTAIPHWYVTFSLGVAMLQPDGGDQAAKVATLLLIPLCIGDDRTWQWSTSRTLVPPKYRGSSLAAHWIFRAQVFLIYFVAASSKLVDDAWQNGSAVLLVAVDPLHGAPVSAMDVLEEFWEPLTASGAWLSWLLIILQFVVAIAVLGRRPVRFVALVIIIALHSAIGGLMALPSFGLIMIGIGLVAYGGGPGGTPPTRPSDAASPGTRTMPRPWRSL